MVNVIPPISKFGNILSFWKIPVCIGMITLADWKSPAVNEALIGEVVLGGLKYGLV